MTIDRLLRNPDRTQRGADVGDLFMSLLQTCPANNVDPFDYMLAVVRNAKAAKADPIAGCPGVITSI